MQYISDPWVIGIGGAIASALIVMLVMRRLLARQEDREYAQRVQVANVDMLHGLRPGVSEGTLAEPAVVSAMLAATARQHDVATDDMYDLQTLVQELVKEVMEASFLSAAQKQERCQALLALAQAGERLPTIEPRRVLASMFGHSEAGATGAGLEYRRRMVTEVSFLLGAVSGLVSMLGVFMSTDAMGAAWGPPGQPPFLLPPVAAVATVAAAVLLISGQSALHRWRRERARPAERSTDTAEEAE